MSRNRSIRSRATSSTTSRPGIWVGLHGTYYTGGATTTDGVKGDDLQKNWRMGATLAIPTTVHHSVKFYAGTGVQTRAGENFNTMGIA